MCVSALSPIGCLLRHARLLDGSLTPHRQVWTEPREKAPVSRHSTAGANAKRGPGRRSSALALFVALGTLPGPAVAVHEKRRPLAVIALKGAMPARRKSSAPCVVRALGPSEPEAAPDVDVFDVEMLGRDGLTDRTAESDADSHCPQNAHRPDQENLRPEPSEEERSGERGERGQDVARSEKKESKGYECKCCPFRCPNLADFQEHVDSSHPNVILNPLYRCAACDFDAQKFELLTEHNESRHPHESDFKFKRMERNNRTVLEQTIPSQGRPGPEDGGAREASALPPRFLTDSVEGLCGRGPERQDRMAAALNINGAVIIPETSVLQDLPHVSPVLRRPPNYQCQPKIAVPLNSAKYNPSLDRNPTLMASFHKFPYPTHAELSWLTASSKHPEEQIKVWFTAQRLKQGITWSPEEVEEARKKMFNGSVPVAHPAFASRPTSLLPVPSAERRFQTSAPSVSVGSTQAPKRSSVAHGGPESKRPVMAVAPSQGEPKDKAPDTPSQPECRSSAAAGGVPPFATETKSPAVVPLVTSSSSLSCAKGKLPSLLGNPKTKVVVSLPSMVFPESLTRPTIAPPPVFAPPFQNSLLLPRLSKEKLCSPLPFPNLPSPVRRLPVIRSAPAPAKVLAGIAPEEERSASEVGTLHTAADGECCREAALGMAEGGELPVVDSQRRSPALTQFPLLERMRGKTAQQLKILEEHFLTNGFLSQSDVDRLALAAGLSRREIDGWFAERRALRDNLELAVLNSMGAKKTEADKDATPPLNGIHQPSLSAAARKSGSGPPPGSVPSSRSPALLKEPFAQTEGLATLSEVWPGLAGADLARWFCDRRSTPHAPLYHCGAASGGAGLPEKSAASSPGGRCREGGAECLEAEPGWPPHAELQDRLAGRCE